MYILWRFAVQSMVIRKTASKKIGLSENGSKHKSLKWNLFQKIDENEKKLPPSRFSEVRVE